MKRIRKDSTLLSKTGILQIISYLGNQEKIAFVFQQAVFLCLETVVGGLLSQENFLLYILLLIPSSRALSV